MTAKAKPKQRRLTRGDIRIRKALVLETTEKVIEKAYDAGRLIFPIQDYEQLLWSLFPSSFQVEPELANAIAVAGKRKRSIC